MASVSSLSGSSSTSSIYGNRNILSGLASGLDTESMIENSIQGYKTKIESLIAKQTKLTWKQDAYRSITDKMIALKNKYTSYSSKTNLSSPSYFNNAVTTTTGGKNADKVSATGRTTSDIKINAVKQLASAARYTVDGARFMDGGGMTAAGGALNLNQQGEDVPVSSFAGKTMSFVVDGVADPIKITFEENHGAYNSVEEFLEEVNNKINEQTYKRADGSEGSVSELNIEVYMNPFVTNGVLSVDGAKFGACDQEITDVFGTLENKTGGNKAIKDVSQLNTTQPGGIETLLKDKSITVSLGTETLRIGLTNDMMLEDRKFSIDKLVSSLNTELTGLFGDKVSVEKATRYVDGKAEEYLNFTTTENSDTFRISSDDTSNILGLSSPVEGKAANKAATGDAMKLDDEIEVSTISGSMTLTVGTKKVTLDFGTDEVYKSAEELATAINTKLEEQNINTRKSGTVKASQLVKAVPKDGGKIEFELGEAAEDGDSAWISGASGNFQKTLGITAGDMEKGDKSIKVPSGDKLYVSQKAEEYLKDKTVTVTLDGVTKKISLGDLTIDKDKGETIEGKVFENLQKGLQEAFGSKVSVELKAGSDGNSLSFTTASKNSTLRVSSEVGKVLGLDNGITNYIDTSSTLKDMLGGKALSEGGLKPITVAEADVVKEGEGDKATYHDKEGNTLQQQKDGSYVRVDEDGKALYALTVNGKQVGAFNEDTALETVISSINNSDAGVKVSYSKLTNRFTFTATETGSQGRIDFGDSDSLAGRLFGAKKSTYQYPNDAGALYETNLLVGADGEPIKVKDGQQEYYVKLQYDENGNEVYYRSSDKLGNSTGEKFEDDSPALQRALAQATMEGFVAGTDAIFSVTVDGEELTLTRSNNTVDLEGLSVTLKGTFNEADEEGNSYFDTDADGDNIFTGIDKIAPDTPVTFTTKANADDLVKVLTDFVNEYNEVIKEVHEAYSTMPAEKNTSKHTKYEPLTDSDKEGMSESEIEKYEEKAKQGILFGDNDLRRAYDSLYNTIAVYGNDRKAMEAIGLTTSYENGVTTLSLDEAKLREALENNPDSVRQVFTDSKENGAKSDGIMARMKRTLDTYASTSIGNYGVLVNLAGTKTSSLTLLNNYVQKQIDNLDNQIDTWQSRMSDKIDYYTRQFTALEQLMAQFNSQSSALAGMMGGSSY